MARTRFDLMDSLYNATVKYIELESPKSAKSIRNIKKALHVIENRTGVWLDENELLAILNDLEIKFLGSKSSDWHAEPDLD